MLERPPSTAKIYAYNFLTIGLYFYFWCSRSRAAVNRAAGRRLVPSTWLLAVPLGNYWWMWRYAQALEFVSYKRLRGSDIFLFYILATSFPLILSGAARYLPTQNSTALPSAHFIVITLIIVGSLLLVLGIAGAAFFCATTQNKINKLTNIKTGSASP